MSCSVHDVVRLERRGVPSVAVATTPFLDEAVEQAHVLAMPGVAVVYVRHPIQLLERDEVRAVAEAAFAALVGALTR